MKTMKFSEAIPYGVFTNDYPNKANKPGIYIWGFLDQKKSFVPYYVGRKYNSVYGRVKSHVNNIRSSSNTYMVFERDFYDPKNIRHNMKQIPKENQPYKYFDQKMLKQLAFRSNAVFLKNKYQNGFDLSKGDGKITSTDCIDAIKFKIEGIVNDVFSNQFLYISYANVELKDCNHNYEILKCVVSQAENATKHKLALKNIHVVSRSTGDYEEDPNKLKWIDLSAIGY